jgi:hypothetical protein
MSASHDPHVQQVHAFDVLTLNAYVIKSMMFGMMFQCLHSNFVTHDDGLIKRGHRLRTSDQAPQLEVRTTNVPWNKYLAATIFPILQS